MRIRSIRIMSYKKRIIIFFSVIGIAFAGLAVLYVFQVKTSLSELGKVSLPEEKKEEMNQRLENIPEFKSILKKNEDTKSNTTTEEETRNTGTSTTSTLPASEDATSTKENNSTSTPHL